MRLITGILYGSALGHPSQPLQHLTSRSIMQGLLALQSPRMRRPRAAHLALFVKPEAALRRRDQNRPAEIAVAGYSATRIGRASFLFGFPIALASCTNIYGVVRSTRNPALRGARLSSMRTEHP